MRNTLFAILTLLPITTVIADTEPNDTWQTAEVLPQDSSVGGVQSDDDWYVLSISSNQTVKRILIDLVFTHADGNINITVYGDDFVISDPAGLVPGLFRDTSSGTNSDHEFVDHNVTGTSPEIYYIHVSGDNLGNSYSLTWTELTSSTDDGFEENDTISSSTAIAESTVVFGLQSDFDWYGVEVAAGKRRVVGSLRFYNTEFATTIDMNMELTDASGTIIASSTNASGINESINQVVPTPGTYHLRIYGDDNRDGYALDWSGLNEAPQAIANTVNTTEDTPYNFTLSDFTFSDSEGDSLSSATLTNLSLGGGTLTHSGGVPVNEADTLTAVQLDTLVYTPPADSSGSPLATFDFTVNDLDAGTVAAQMGINVTAVDPAPTDTSSSSGALSPAWLLALMLAGLGRRKSR